MKTAEEISLNFCEKFQENYPDKNLFELMLELAEEIKLYADNIINSSSQSPVIGYTEDQVRELLLRQKEIFLYEMKMCMLKPEQHSSDRNYNEAIIYAISKVKNASEIELPTIKEVGPLTNEELEVLKTLVKEANELMDFCIDRGYLNNEDETDGQISFKEAIQKATSLLNQREEEKK